VEVGVGIVTEGNYTGMKDKKECINYPTTKKLIPDI